MKQLKSLPKIVKMVYFKPALHEKAELLSQFIDLSQIARREGILALEGKVQEIDDPFFARRIAILTE